MSTMNTAPATQKANAKASAQAGAVLTDSRAEQMLTIARIEKEILLGHQQPWAADDARFLCGVWARQTGKSFSTAEKVAKDVAGTPKTMWMVAAPSERQSLESLAKVRDWLEAFSVAFEDDIAELAETQYKAAAITLANGSRVIAVPGKPDTVRGMSCNVWMDEFAFFEDPDATWKAILPSITNPLRGGQKRVIITSTPNGKTGRGKRFWDIVSEPNKGKIQWSVHKVTLPDAIAAGLPVDYEELAAAMDDPLAEAQELRCEFLDGSNQLLPLDLIAAAESMEATTACDLREVFNPRHHGELRCGIDFGRTNDPTVCWTLEKVGDTWVTREVLVLKNCPSDVQEQELRRRIACATRVCYDYTGPGIGLGDYLVKDFGVYDPKGHKFGKMELCTFSRAFKCEIFPRLRRAFETPVRVRIPLAQEIRDDLTAMQQVYQGASVSYEAPHTSAGHSDRCTALALAWRATEGAAVVLHFGELGPAQRVRRAVARTLQRTGAHLCGFAEARAEFERGVAAKKRKF